MFSDLNFNIFPFCWKPDTKTYLGNKWGKKVCVLPPQLTVLVLLVQLAPVH